MKRILIALILCATGISFFPTSAMAKTTAKHHHHHHCHKHHKAA